MRKAVICACLAVAGCSGAPSKEDVAAFEKSFIRGESTVEVTDLRCTEKDNEIYTCFTAMTVTLEGGTVTTYVAEDANYTKVAGEWQSDLREKMVPQYPQY